jgi:hypothetical protein
VSKLEFDKIFENFSFPNYSKHTCKGYGDILWSNSIKSSGLKRVYISKVYYEPLTKDVNYDRSLFEFNWAV